MENLERAEVRLKHIRTVVPILSALRTISLGSWRAALRQSASVRRYEGRLATILALLVPHLPGRQRAELAAQRSGYQSVSTLERVVVAVIGTERGLCGRFNARAVTCAEQHLAEQEATGVQIELVAVGARASRILKRRQWPLAWSGSLSVATLPSYRMAFEVTSRWLRRYEEHELDAVDLVYNAYHGTGRYEPTVARLIPPELPHGGPGSLDECWLPPIIETDLAGLYTRVIEQWTVASLYERLLESAAAEHSARYQIMEEATQNANRLITGLTLAVQLARQHEITQEMQELAAGAGLIGPR
jgi:F-type H+-transporting ATPase subunit gamma